MGRVNFNEAVIGLVGVLVCVYTREKTIHQVLRGGGICAGFSIGEISLAAWTRLDHYPARIYLLRP
jgi:hypothetical protein